MCSNIFMSQFTNVIKLISIYFVIFIYYYFFPTYSIGLVANFTLLYKIVSLDISPESAETTSM